MWLDEQSSYKGKGLWVYTLFRLHGTRMLQLPYLVSPLTRLIMLSSLLSISSIRLPLSIVLKANIHPSPELNPAVGIKYSMGRVHSKTGDPAPVKFASGYEYARVDPMLWYGGLSKVCRAGRLRLICGTIGRDAYEGNGPKYWQQTSKSISFSGLSFRK
jgi:hypothetical protein